VFYVSQTFNYVVLKIRLKVSGSLIYSSVQLNKDCFVIQSCATSEEEEGR